MKTEYKRDTRHSYLIITEEEDIETKRYCMKMLQYQHIDGILPVEQKRFNENVLYYYDITAKQSMAALFDKSVFSAERLRRLCGGIINILERAYEYLLPGEDFILIPEYIFLGVESDEPALCFLPGYSKGVREQLSLLLEHLMNRVDYNDKEAVLLVYRMYAVSREEGYTLEHLKKELEEQTPTGAKVCSSEKELTQEKRSESWKSDVDYVGTRDGITKGDYPDSIPLMAEKLEQEHEIEGYPIKTYLYTLAAIIFGMLAIGLFLKSGLIYNVYGNRLDYSKLAALLLIVFCGEGYLMKMIWDKRNRITRMITKSEYVDPRSFIQRSAPEVMEEESVAEKLKKASSRDKEDKPVHKTISNIEDNPTCLLNSAGIEKTEDTIISIGECRLTPIDNAEYQTITVKEYPFYIGKLHKKVDYCLNQETVSRYHAKLIKENGRYFIMDMNSTNGTFVNNEALVTYEQKEISQGDEIRFADIRYRLEVGTEKSKKNEKSLLSGVIS